ncbi:MAG TPA: ABC transporter ATP-binding protein [Dehalococcoidia bacterium]|nr:ABC transporter ATP-binding protein [Dehalococcoidia bacterium]
MTAPLLETSGLTVAYGERVALRDVSLTVRKGELVGMIGPNGAGKSTFIRAVTRVVQAQAGAIHLGGDSVQTLSRRELGRRAAVVPQTGALPELFSALEVVLMGRTPHLGLLQHESDADLLAARQAMEATGCWQLAYRRLGELSGGERQAVLLARALAQEAPLLLLDEPTAHLDIGHQAAALALVRLLCARGSHGALAVVHDLTLASQFCQRLVVLQAGRVVAEGPPAEVINAERVRQVYEAEAHVFAHPLTGLPVVVPDAGLDASGL